MQCCVGEIVQLTIVCKKRCMSASVDSDTAVTLIATLSEDPANWQEMASYWPRYRTPVVLHNLDDIQFSIEVTDGYLERLSSELPEDGWLFIDFDSKRIVTSPSLSISGHNRVFDLYSDESPEKRWPLSIHLPPWWELVDAAKPKAIVQARDTGPIVPRTNRGFLYGKPLVEHIAEQVFACTPKNVHELLLHGDFRSMHMLTIEIHRNWLMTKRHDLNGVIPRQLLHGAQEWIGRVIEAQELRIREGSPSIPDPTNVLGFESAPMGREEIVVYFDLCRHLIATAWEWLSRIPVSGRNLDTGEKTPQQSLVEYLENARDEFLSSSYEGGSTPMFIIQCSRQRVPRSPDIAIEGFLEQEKGHDRNDCDCPICHIMVNGDLGPSFVSLDGYHLELEEEFAFSLYETRLQWQEESLFLSDEEGEKTDDEFLVCEPIGGSGSSLAEDYFGSAWDGIRSMDPLPGDPTGQIKLAFMLAEIVAQLQGIKTEPHVIRKLNDLFKTFRETSGAASGSAKANLIEQLESCAVRYPQLVPRIADFQSHLNQTLQKSTM